MSVAGSIRLSQGPGYLLHRHHIATDEFLGVWVTEMRVFSFWSAFLQVVILTYSVLYWIVPPHESGFIDSRQDCALPLVKAFDVLNEGIYADHIICVASVEFEEN